MLSRWLADVLRGELGLLAMLGRWLVDVLRGELGWVAMLSRWLIDVLRGGLVDWGRGLVDVRGRLVECVSRPPVRGWCYVGSRVHLHRAAQTKIVLQGIGSRYKLLFLLH